MKVKKEERSWREALLELPAALAMTPTMPVPAFIREAGELETMLREQSHVRMRLHEVGLEPRFVDELPARIDRLREAQSAWSAIGDRAKTSERREREDEGYALRDELLAAGRYSFRKQSDKLARVQQIADGDDLAELAQDLNDLAVLYDQNPEAFRRVGVGTEKARRARELGGELSHAGRPRPADAAEALALRDRAYGDLSEAVDEIRAAGLFAYRDDKAMAARFRSRYFLLRGRRARRRAADRKAQAPAGAAETPTA